MQANKYIQLTKYDKKQKYVAVIQRDKTKAGSTKSNTKLIFFFSDIKRVYYIMITVGKVSQS